MSTLRLWAIGIDEVRGIFSADPDTADRLRQAAQQRFGAADKPQPGLLGKLGPFLRRGGDPAAPRPGVPTSEDVEDLLTGRFIPPHRLTQAWNLLEFWLGDLAAGAGEWPLTEAGLTELDFDLARAQVPSRYTISDLFKASLGISLTRCPGLAAGWVPGQHALGMLESWPTALPELSQENQQLASGIIDFLSGFSQWTDQARTEGRAQPDLIAIFRA
jgi:hypothetical protein